MPALVPVVDKIEDVPEAARQFYTQRDGKFHVDLSAAPAGFVPAAELNAANAKVIEFRDTNVNLNKKVSELEPIAKKFEGIDPDAAKAALAKVTELAAGGVKDPKDVQALVTAAVEAAVKPLQSQLSTITSTAEQERKRAETLTLRGTISDVFAKAGGQSDALDYIVSKTAGVFVVENGTVKAAAGQYSADRPGEPLTIEEWMTRQTRESSFAFKPSGGGGGLGNGKPGDKTPTRAGVTILKDPTPAQLGEASKDILAGKVKVEYSADQAAATR